MTTTTPAAPTVHPYTGQEFLDSLDDGREVVAQAVVGAGGENQRLSIRMFFYFI